MPTAPKLSSRGAGSTVRPPGAGVNFGAGVGPGVMVAVGVGGIVGIGGVRVGAAVAVWVGVGVAVLVGAAPGLPVLVAVGVSGGSCAKAGFAENDKIARRTRAIGVAMERLKRCIGISPLRTWRRSLRVLGINDRASN